MKTYRITSKLAIVTGTDAELDKVEQVAAGTHFLTAYGNKRGGPRKAREWEPEKACQHGKGMTDYCLPCGRVNGGG